MTPREFKELAKKGEWPVLRNPCPITNRHVPYLDPTTISIVSALSSGGKTSFSKYWMFQYVEDALKNGTKLKILWLALEESAEQFIYSVKSYLLGKRGFDLNMADMMCITIDEHGSRRILTEEEVQAIEDIEPELKDFMNIIELKVFNDEYNPANPTGVYKWLREKALEYGAFYRDGKKVSREDVLKGSSSTEGYLTYEKDRYVIVVVDNVNNLKGEGNLNEKQVIRKFVGNYCNSIVTKLYKFHVMLLQQQWKTSMGLEHIEARHIYPTMDGLAVDKDTGNDCRLCIGITDPFEHERIYSWPRTKTFQREQWKDKFRVLSIPKNTLFGARITTEDKMIPLFFEAKKVKFTKL